MAHSSEVRSLLGIPPSGHHRTNRHPTSGPCGATNPEPRIGRPNNDGPTPPYTCPPAPAPAPFIDQQHISRHTKKTRVGSGTSFDAPSHLISTARRPCLKKTLAFRSRRSLRRHLHLERPIGARSAPLWNHPPLRRTARPRPVDTGPLLDRESRRAERRRSQLPARAAFASILVRAVRPVRRISLPRWGGPRTL